MQYILFAAILGFYSLLFMTLMLRACRGIWQGRRPQIAPKMEKISHAVAKARSRAWTRAVWRGTLAHEAQ